MGVGIVLTLLLLLGASTEGTARAEPEAAGRDPPAASELAGETRRAGETEHRPRVRSVAPRTTRHGTRPVRASRRPPAADRAQEGPPAQATEDPAEATQGFAWSWAWDRGVRYEVQVPFDALWTGPDRLPLSGAQLEQRLAFIGKIGGLVQVDAAAFGETRGLEGAESGAEIRRLRFGTRGDFFLLGHASYALDLELVGTELQVGDVYLWWSGLPLVGTLKIGNFTPPFSLEAVTAARDTVFMETGLPVQAFAPGRSAGIQLASTALGERLTWAAGLFRTIARPTVGDQSREGGRATARVSWLPEEEPALRRLTHLGASTSVLFAAEDVQYQSRPESHLAPDFVDTGTLRSSGNSVVAGLEAARIDDRWLFLAEALLAAVQGEEDATLWGGYAAVARFLTDDVQPYDRSSGKLARFEPPRPFSWSRGTYGSLRAAARVSYLDLESGAVNGGRETNLTADLSWFLDHYLTLKLEYGFAAVRDRPNGGNLHFVQARLQLDFY